MTQQTSHDKNVNVQPPKVDAFADRINVAAKRAGGVTNLANKMGMSTSVLRSWRSGRSDPSRQSLIKMAEAGDVDLAWLATGEGNMQRSLWFDEEKPRTSPAVQPGYAPHGKNSEYAPIRLYDIQAAAGNGAVVGAEQIADTLMFKRSWIHQELHAQPNDLYLIFVDGESMEPTLRPGDIILVDRRDAASIPRDGVYVLRMDNSLLVKRLQRLPGRKVKVTSDNPAYEPFDLALDAPGEDLAIIGRVVWSGRRM